MSYCAERRAHAGAPSYLAGLLAWTLAYSVFLAVSVLCVRCGASRAFTVLAAGLANLVFLAASLRLLWGTLNLRAGDLLLVAAMLLGLIASRCLVYVIPDRALRGVVQAPLLMLTAWGLSRLLVDRIERSWHIAAAGLVGLAADLWSVFSSSGVTRRILESHPEALEYLLLAFPVPSSGARPILGVADYAFFAIFMLHAEKFGYSRSKSAIALVAGLVTVLLLVNVTGMGLPAVPFMALAFLAVNLGDIYRDFRIDLARWLKGGKE